MGKSASEFLTNDEIRQCINDAWDMFFDTRTEPYSAARGERDAQLSIITHYLIQRKEAEKRNA